MALIGAPRTLDARLVTEAVEGSSEAYAELVRPCLASALSVATLVTGSPADAADAVQDAMVSAWRGLRTLRDPAAFPAWFRRHVIRAALRMSTRRSKVAPLELCEPTWTPGFEGGREAVLAGAFERLEPKDRAILSLRYVADLTVPQIAAALDVPEGTVKSRLHAAVRRLRAAYDAEERR